MRVGIIDLGSNTFHLLVAEKCDTRFKILHKDRQFVHLSEKGVEHLEEDIIDRAFNTLKAFKQKALNYGAESVHAYGTETLRKADNADDFTELVREKLSLEINIIDGQREAELIAKGVDLISDKRSQNSIIVDIGGGSVEFIFCQNGKTVSQYSFPIGSTVLYNRFHKQDPITPSEIEALCDHLNQILTPLINTQEELQIDSLIGCSGTFEVLSRLSNLDTPFHELEIKKSLRFMDEIIHMDIESRKAHPQLPEWRAKLMPVALLLCKWMLDRLKIKSFYFSHYSLKEGILSEVLDASNN